MTNKISHEELDQLLNEPDIDESQIRDYIEVDLENSSPFLPSFKANPQMVLTQEGDHRSRLGNLNDLSRRLRQKRYNKKISEGFTGTKIVSEGDSWFQFPILLKDVVDQLFDDYAIYSLEAGGALLEEMIDKDEFTQAIQEQNPDIFMISGGGNDLVIRRGQDGDNKFAGVKDFVSNFDESESLNPVDYIKPELDLFVIKIMSLYRNLFNDLLSKFSELKIIFHGYDYPIPRNIRPLGKPLTELGFSNEFQKEIMKIIVDRMNTAQISLVNEPALQNKVFHVDCRGAVNSNNWFDEFHPKNPGFESVANRFRIIINDIT